MIKNYFNRLLHLQRRTIFIICFVLLLLIGGGYYGLQKYFGEKMERSNQNVAEGKNAVKSTGNDVSSAANMVNKVFTEKIDPGFNSVKRTSDTIKAGCFVVIPLMAALLTIVIVSWLTATYFEIKEASAHYLSTQNQNQSQKLYRVIAFKPTNTSQNNLFTIQPQPPFNQPQPPFYGHESDVISATAGALVYFFVFYKMYEASSSTDD